jgi:hypothetical protein
LPGKPDMMQVILPELRLSRSSRAAEEAQAKEAENRDSNTKKSES